MSRLRRNESTATNPQGAAVKHIYKIQQPVGTMRANDARDNHRLLEGQEFEEALLQKPWAQRTQQPPSLEGSWVK